MCAYVHVVCTCVCVCACVHSIPLSLLYTAVRTIVAIDHMIEIVETAITAHFAAFSCVEDQDDQLVWQNEARVSSAHIPLFHPTRLLLSTYAHSTILTHPSSPTLHQTRPPPLSHPTHLTLPSLHPFISHTPPSTPHSPILTPPSFSPPPPHMHSPILTSHTPHSSILTPHPTPSLPLLVLPFPPSVSPA